MSQDIHTPRVIASPFLSKKRLRAILKPSARRWPETLPTMDEVDGRPGPVALQFGHLDALKRVPTASLSLPLKFTVILPQPMGAPSLRRLCFCRKGGIPRLSSIRFGLAQIGPAISEEFVRNHQGEAL
jgi:hypothetical protein